jgi:putative ABC transport system substrate-binding protein
MALATGDRVKRRQFIAGAGVALIVSTVAGAQPIDRPRKIGILYGLRAGDPEWSKRFAAFKQRLQRLGWIEGTNISFEVRHAIGNPDQFAIMAADLVQAKVDLIFVNNAGLAAIAQAVTRTIPIVVSGAGELEGTGLIVSLKRPQGNVTGIQVLGPDLMSKRMELLKQLVPGLNRVGVIEPITPATIITSHYFEVLNEAAQGLQIQIHRVPARSPAEITSAVHTMLDAGDQAAMVISNPLSLESREELIHAAAQNRLPIIYESRPFVVSGGLISYGADSIQLVEDATNFVHQILMGAKPGELPVQQPTKFELVINLKTAKALDLTISEAFLLQANDVLE